MISPSDQQLFASVRQQEPNNALHVCPHQSRHAVAQPNIRQSPPLSRETMRAAYSGIRDIEREISAQRQHAFIATRSPLRYCHVDDLRISRCTVDQNVNHHPQPNIVPPANHVQPNGRYVIPLDNRQQRMNHTRNLLRLNIAEPVNPNSAMRSNGFVPVEPNPHGIPLIPVVQPRVIARPAIVRNAVCARCDSHVCILGMLAAQFANQSIQEPNNQFRPPVFDPMPTNDSDNLIMIPEVSSTTYSEEDEIEDEDDWPDAHNMRCGHNAGEVWHRTD